MFCNYISVSILFSKFLFNFQVLPNVGVLSSELTTEIYIFGFAGSPN